MEEIFKQRKVELEIAAKNIIVEMHLIKAKSDEIASMIETREKQLDSINAALMELDHIEKLVTAEQAREEAQVLKEKEEAQAPKEKE
jgi:uncharacterized membrane protein YgaE (UPF0421/DUF939 family)